MADDPLLGLVSRALGAPVDEIAVERVRTSPLAEVDRIRWRGAAGQGRLLFKRMHRAASVEAGLLPALARRGFPVEEVLASGIPPRHVAEPRPWILVREAEGVALCELAAAESRRTAEALRAIHTSTQADLALLRVLGVAELSPDAIRDEALAATALLAPPDAARLREIVTAFRPEAVGGAPPALVHGDLVCENVSAVRERLVFREWSRAHVGSPLEDVGALARSLRARSPALAAAALDAYPVDPAVLGQAERLHVLAAVRWHAWEAREGIRTMRESADAIAPLIG